MSEEKSKTDNDRVSLQKAPFMKKFFTYLGLLIFGAFIGLLLEQGQSGRCIINAKDETIHALRQTIQAKDAIIAKDDDLLNTCRATDAGRSENNVQNEPVEMDPKDIFPADNGFDAQDLGSGFFAYQVFGPLLNVCNVEQPKRIKNRTPWKFGPGNSGITANGSGFLMVNAKNGDSDGAKSTSGQAGFLEFKDSSISQSINLKSGTYTVVFDWEGRPNYPANKISVSLDDSTLFVGTPTSSESFERVQTKPINFEKSANHELIFRGLGGPREFTGDTFIDNIKIRPVESSANEPTPPVESEHANDNSPTGTTDVSSDIL